MNKVSVIALLVFPIISWASSDEADSDKACGNVEVFSGKIMEARQEGVSLTDMMKIAGDNSALRRITLEAYDYPRITTPSLLRKVIQDFKNEQVLKCYKIFSRSNS